MYKNFFESNYAICQFLNQVTIILYIIIQNMCKERKRTLKIFPV